MYNNVSNNEDSNNQGSTVLVCILTCYASPLFFLLALRARAGFPHITWFNPSVHTQFTTYTILLVLTMS